MTSASAKRMGVSSFESNCYLFWGGFNFKRNHFGSSSLGLCRSLSKHVAWQESAFFRADRNLDVSDDGLPKTNESRFINPDGNCSPLDQKLPDLSFLQSL